MLELQTVSLLSPSHSYAPLGSRVPRIKHTPVLRSRPRRYTKRMSCFVTRCSLLWPSDQGRVIGTPCSRFPCSAKKFGITKPFVVTRYWVRCLDETIVSPRIPKLVSRADVLKEMRGQCVELAAPARNKTLSCLRLGRVLLRPHRKNMPPEVRRVDRCTGRLSKIPKRRRCRW